MNGILIVDKPKGFTSHDVVDFVRKRFNIKKAGHAGTLDPMATGVLIVLIGKATKEAPRFLNDDKTYEGTLVFGATSNTGDGEGEILRGSDSWPDEKTTRDIFKGFMGKIKQVPPMFSAKKIGGKKLYEFARKGIQVKREPRIVEVKSMEIKSLNMPEVVFEVSVSKGTYIRQLVSDIGKRAGCGAYLKELKRTKSGIFGVDRAISFERLKTAGTGVLDENLLPI